MKILVTRPEKTARQTAKKLEALGHEPIITSLFKLEKIAAPKPPSPQTQATILTSQNGAEALVAANWFGDIQDTVFYLVGQKSADFLERKGVQNIRHVAQNSEELITHLNQLDALHFTYCTGFHYALQLDALNTKHTIDVLPLYRADPDQSQIDVARALVHQLDVDGILIYSARAAQIIGTQIVGAHPQSAQIINHMDRLRLYCLSKNIAQILGDILGQHAPPLIWPQKPDEQALLDMLPRNI